MRIGFLASLAAALALLCPRVASATITTTSNTVTYSASGSSGTFAVPFKFFKTSDLVVTDNGVTKSLGGDYTVTCAGCQSGGTVVFSVNPTAGHAIIITRSIPLTQLFDPANQGKFKPSAYGDAFDTLEAQIQQNNALFTNPPATVLPANVTAKLNGIRFADQFANIQAAITDAGTTGAVLIPSTYVASDTYSNPNSIPIIDLRSGASHWRGAVLSSDFGTIADNVADDTAKLQAGLNATPTGGEMFIPAGTYKLSGTGLTISKSMTLRLAPGAVLSSAGTSIIVVSNATGVTIRGGKLILLTDTTGTDVQAAISPLGTVTDLTINGVTVSGQGTVQDGSHAWQYGLWNLSGQTLTNIKVKNCDFSSLNAGISFNADTGGSIVGALAEDNYIHGIVGTASGSGYCVHLANGSGTPDYSRIVHNFLDSCQRHSVYHAKGSGGVIAGNVIRQHRAGVFDGSQLPAIFVDRSQDVTVSTNYLDQPADGAIAVNSETSTGAGNVCRNISITGNVIVNPKGSPPILIGDGSPSTNGFCDGVAVTGNTVYNDTTVSGYSSDLVRINQGKRITVVANSFTWLNANNTNGVFGIRGTSEGAGTATYTDDLKFGENSIFGTNASGSHMFGFNWSTAACTSGIRVELDRNRFNTPAAVHVLGAAVTDPNIIGSGYAQMTGMTAGIGTPGTVTLGAGTGTATVPTGSICFCQDQTANASTKCVVATNTLTITGTGTDVINYNCPF